MREQRFCSTKYCSVVALPSLTSWVHCSSGSLIPNALSIAKAMSRKSRLSMPRSLMAWLSGLIVSRGMSQVSAMMLATVSNVEDIANILANPCFPQACPDPQACLPRPVGSRLGDCGPCSEARRGVQCRGRPVSGYWLMRENAAGAKWRRRCASPATALQIGANPSCRCHKKRALSSPGRWVTSGSSVARSASSRTACPGIKGLPPHEEEFHVQDHFGGRRGRIHRVGRHRARAERRFLQGRDQGHRSRQQDLHA